MANDNDFDFDDIEQDLDAQVKDEPKKSSQNSKSDSKSSNNKSNGNSFVDISKMITDNNILLRFTYNRDFNQVRMTALNSETFERNKGQIKIPDFKKFTTSISMPMDFIIGIIGAYNNSTESTEAITVDYSDIIIKGDYVPPETNFAVKNKNIQISIGGNKIQMKPVAAYIFIEICKISLEMMKLHIYHKVTN